MRETTSHPENKFDRFLFALSAFTLNRDNNKNYLSKNSSSKKVLYQTVTKILIFKSRPFI
jgi:hypothetical protein